MVAVPCEVVMNVTSEGKAGFTVTWIMAADLGVDFPVKAYCFL